MIEKGKHIRCMFHNGFVVEGVVEEWGNKKAVLISLSDESELIIPNTSRDIMFIKVVLPEKEKISVSEIDNRFEETINEPPSDLKNKRLAELRILKSEAEKKIISEKLKDHSIGQPRMVEYGIPGFYKKQGSE